jgi:hypothetical protein
VSFVILGAYAPPGEPAEGDAGAASLPLLFVVAQAAATGDAGPASFPLLFNLASPIVVEPPPDPEPDPLFSVDWRDHSPDLLLFLEAAAADGFILEAVPDGDVLVLVDHAPTTLLFAEPSLAALEWVDHPSLTYPSDSRFPSENTYPSNN